MALDARIKEAAIKGLDVQISELDGRISELRSMRDSLANDEEYVPMASSELTQTASDAGAQGVGKRRGRPPGKRLSVAARKKLSDAMKRRWAERRARTTR